MLKALPSARWISINTRFGIRRKDDTLPKRLTDEPQDPKDETTKVPLEKMKNVYYGARGWTQDGVPTPKTLKRLGLDKLASYKVTCEEFKNRCGDVSTDRNRGEE